MRSWISDAHQMPARSAPLGDLRTRRGDKRDVHARLAAVAYEQDGLITRRQALAAGASPDAIRHNLGDSRRWQVVVPGIYAAFTGPLAQIHRLRAAVLHGGVTAMITGVAACRMIDLRYVPGDSAKVDILVHRRSHPLDVGFIRVHRTERLPAPVWWMDTSSPAPRTTTTTLAPGGYWAMTSLPRLGAGPFRWHRQNERSSMLRVSTA
jgi:hypothetical protein